MALQYNVGPTSQSSGGLFGLLGNIPIGGPDESGNFVLTVGGVAVARGDGTCVSVDPDDDILLDVTALVLAGVDPCVIRVPIPLGAVRRGDLLITSGSPFSSLFVLSVEDSRITGLDPISGAFVWYTPPINPFANFFVVAISLYDLLARNGGQRGHGEEAGREGGRWRMLLPLLLLSSGQNIFGGSAGTSVSTSTTPPSLNNPLLLVLLAMMGGHEGFGEFFGHRRDGEGEEAGREGGRWQMLLPLLLLSSGQNIFGGSAGTSVSTSTAPTPPSPNNPLLLMLLAMMGGHEGFGEFFGHRREGDDERHGREQWQMLLPMLLLSSGQNVLGSSTGTSVSTSTTSGTPTAPALSNPLFLMLVAMMGGQDGFGEFFGHHREGGDDERHGRERWQMLLPLLLLSSGQNIFGGSTGTSVSTSTTSATPPAVPSPNNPLLLMLAAMMGGREGFAEFFGRRDEGSEEPHEGPVRSSRRPPQRGRSSAGPQEGDDH